MFKGLAYWMAWRLPREVLFFAVMRAWSEVRTGRWPDGDEDWALRSVFQLRHSELPPLRSARGDGGERE